MYHWASITKTLTAIAILQLRDRGRLTLDDPIVRYVPELRQVHDEFGSIDDVTLRMLLSHCAGFQNPTWPYGEGRPLGAVRAHPLGSARRDDALPGARLRARAPDSATAIRRSSIWRA